MKTYDEPGDIYVSKQCHEKLLHLIEEGVFVDMRGAFSFALGYALSKNINDYAVAGDLIKIFGASTVDPDRKLYETVKLFRENNEEPVYKTMQRIAEYGINKIHDRFQEQGGVIDFLELFDSCQEQ